MRVLHVPGQKEEAKLGKSQPPTDYKLKPVDKSTSILIGLGQAMCLENTSISSHFGAHGSVPGHWEPNTLESTGHKARINTTLKATTTAKL